MFMDSLTLSMRRLIGLKGESLFNKYSDNCLTVLLQNLLDRRNGGLFGRKFISDLRDDIES